MKRILIFSVAYHPFIGGAEVAVKEITDRVQHAEFDMITVNLDGNQSPVEQIGNIRVYRVGTGTMGKLLLPFTGVKKALELHKAHPYDAVWSIMASWAGVAAARFKQRAKLPMVLTVQEGDEESHLMRYTLGNEFLYKRLIQPWHRLPFERADVLSAISTYLLERSKQSGATCPMALVPNGVDVSVFTRPIEAAQIQKTKDELNKKSGDIFLITTSRLVEKNGIGDVIAALPHLPEHVKFIILGTGHLEQTLKDQAASLKVSDRVTFVGQVPYADIPRYLAASDIFIRPSLSEGMGNSFIEAMAAGIPVIGTPVGGITDFLTEGETGVLCEPHNSQSIVTKVKLLAESPELRKHIIEKARALAVSQYDWNLVAQKMKNEIFARVNI